MWLFKNDCCILIQTLSIYLDCIDVSYQKQLVCSIPRPKTWYWLWLEDLLICTWSEKQKYLKNKYFFSYSRYVDDVISRIGRMFPDMSIELFRPNGTSAVLLVRCFVLHRSLQQVFLYILIICILWSVSEWQVLFKLDFSGCFRCIYGSTIWLTCYLLSKTEL